MNDWLYRFEFHTGDTIDIEARWSEDDGVIQATPGPDSLPDDLKQSVWLENDQCSHCPLVPSRSPLCPLAATIIPVTHRFEQHDSTEAVRVIATSRDREVRADTNLQRGLGSLLGLLMGGSACPHFAFFRPMAAMHLPFSNDEETFFRVIGNALLSLAMRDEETSLDQANEHLKKQYEALGVVNLGMAQRLRRCATTDSGINAVIVLDMLARLIGDDPEEYIEALRPWYT
ncbi:DUF6901 family protein [Saccharospirillum salsuginis]|uniref:Uncharacterized protein n=1 Tax=Saccharospirillum salsuginis TaxID=418750 RepID=A0A918KBT7_9GAMM|nr:hypothetical protein [Saccharospirillum salsuginis]GGX56823.1 hypothetical protein GCM10007392_25360 [Saccharospirillum salsuginis]